METIFGLKLCVTGENMKLYLFKFKSIVNCYLLSM